MYGEMKESWSPLLIAINDMCPVVFDALLRYIYIDSLPPTTTTDEQEQDNADSSEVGKLCFGMMMLDDDLKDEQLRSRKCLRELEKLKEDIDKVQAELTRAIQQMRVQQQQQQPQPQPQQESGGAAPATGPAAK
ncbi:hypothetical protein ABZP36_024855 [Zizania latifolia]